MQYESHVEPITDTHGLMVCVFEIQGDGGSLYSTWGGGATSSSSYGAETIEINGLFSSKQCIQHDEEVLVSQLQSVASCSQLFVEPLSINDWEILEQHAAFIESNLLQQVRAVWIGQVIPIWVQKSICVFVKIGNMVPSTKCCLLEQNSEVYVAPKARNAHLSKAVNDSSKTKNRRPETNGSARSESDKPRVRNMSGNKFVNDLKKAAENYNDTDIKGLMTDPQNEDQVITEDKPKQEPGALSKALGFFKSFWSVESEAERTTEESCDIPAASYSSEILRGNLDCSLRVQSLDSAIEDALDHDEETSLFLRQVSTVFISNQTFRKFCSSKVNKTRTFLAVMSKLPSPAEREEIQNQKSRQSKNSVQSASRSQPSNELESLEETGSPREVIVRVVVSDSIKRLLRGHVAISDVLRGQLQYETSARVRISAVTEDEVIPKQLKLSPMFTPPQGYTKDMLQTAAATWCEHAVSVERPLVISQGIIVQIALNADFQGYFFLSFPVTNPQPHHYCLLSPLATPSLVIGDQVKPSSLPQSIARFAYSAASSPCQDVDLPLPSNKISDLGGISSVVDALRPHLSACLCCTPLPAALFTPGPASGSPLLCGPRGSGKSTVARAVARSYAEWPYLANVSTVNCKPLRGKRLESIRKTFERVFHEASWRQPAVILLDDLDHLTAAPSGPEQEMSGEAVYYTRVAEVLKDIMEEVIQAKSQVVVIATSRSRSSLHQSLVSSRGKHYFTEIVNLKSPDKDDREAILNSLLLHKSCVDPVSVDDLDLDKVRANTEGFVARDLEMVVDRAIHAHQMVHAQETLPMELSIHQSDLDVALSGFTPSALRHVSLHKAGELGWADVGGLSDVRRTLVETLQWPAKYPALFASCPLRLRSGLLLYGAPGTGKTLLAGIVAKECGLNFISIKGPELLSKYIGASEQAVRDTFIRAQSAKPCILFFDEFDSLAPRRGHDSTGVTDRVVNQLLTQLDGVEGLQGVYVLGATSRPDLIDPALLRPGRLDKALHCNMPDENDRLEILKSLTRHMTLDPDVDLTYLAEACEHFTGADYKALLYNAQLEAIHEFTGHLRRQTDQEQNAQLDNGDIKSEGQITQSDIIQKSDEQMLDKVVQNGYLNNGDATSEFNENTSEITSELSPKKLIMRNEDDEEYSLKKFSIINGPTSDDLEVSPDLQKVVEKPRDGASRVLHIPNLEEGCVSLTHEQEQEILSVYDKSVSPSGDKKPDSQSSSVICQRHLVAAARGMGPSVSSAERRKYRKIYENFVASRGGNFSDQVPAGGKKATLA